MSRELELELFEFIPDLISLAMVAITIVLARYFLDPLNDGKSEVKSSNMTEDYESLKNTTKYAKYHSELTEDFLNNRKGGK